MNRPLPGTSNTLNFQDNYPEDQKADRREENWNQEKFCVFVNETFIFTTILESVIYTRIKEQNDLYLMVSREFVKSILKINSNLLKAKLIDFKMDSI
ncbi:hypothetical protein LEP1GSC188_2755 [Leptospira weilii serovar Topaz str. LT2116]|uniref:Uncharacterized protein n=1 Tax=Leptospira weilii serovar Topaz str. LT2116 TaxID=1088540 RepID=M3H129_9LEPT|nr:hypothetical protein [Leptospira weilii]EMF82856.1 hypothetical protein LEP1GSC188_2755 [Leptospira weilii serovar Topaz str. LT2116]